MSEGEQLDNAGAFDAWFNNFLRDYFARRPVSATFIGAHQYDHDLPDYSIEAEADLISGARWLLDELRHISNDGLSEAQRHDRQLAEGFLEIQLWEAGSPFFQAGNPAHHTGEGVFSVISLFQRDSEPQSERVDTAISRIGNLPIFLENARRRVVCAPLPWTERAIREADAGTEYFGNGLNILARERGIADPEFLKKAGAAAQAFAEHSRWLRDELAARPVDFQPCGREAFDRYLQKGHALPPEQNTDWVLEYGRAELARARSDMEALAADIDPSRSWREQLASLLELHPRAEDYYATFPKVWESCRQAALASELVTWPDFPITFWPIPLSDREAAKDLYYLYYRCPPPFGDHASQHYLVPPCEPTMTEAEQKLVLRGTNHAQIKLNHVIHHAGLGHHVQNWSAFRAESRIGQFAGTDCASRIAMFCGGTLVEGWACYATELMEEIGALTPLERLSEAQTRLRMAARAYADAALHSGELTIAETARFYEEDTAMAPAAAMGEAVKNSMFPGAAMMYLCGTKGIHQLRSAMAQRQGSAFSLRSFHDQFLSYGAIPVAIIAAAMLANEPEHPG